MANGAYTNVELIETILVDVNNMLKELFNGQYINACCDVNNIAKKLLNLREAVDNDMKNREQIIEQLKEQLRNAGREIVEYTPQEYAEKMKKDGAGNGTD